MDFLEQDNSEISSDDDESPDLSHLTADSLDIIT